MSKVEADVFLRACPKCGKMWRGVSGLRAWVAETFKGEVESRAVFVDPRYFLEPEKRPVGGEWNGTCLGNVEVCERIHRECGGRMLTHGRVARGTTSDRDRYVLHERASKRVFGNNATLVSEPERVESNLKEYLAACDPDGALWSALVSVGVEDDPDLRMAIANVWVNRQQKRVRQEV